MPTNETVVRTAEPSEPRPRDGSLALLVDEYGQMAMVVTALITHAVNAFNYPLYLGDEGIYLEQAWAVIRAGALAPYT